jgi:hypothetical protein
VLLYVPASWLELAHSHYACKSQLAGAYNIPYKVRHHQHGQLQLRSFHIY